MCVAEPLVIYDACRNLWRLFLAVAISPRCFRAIKGQILPLTGTLPWLQEAVILERCNPIHKLPGVHLCQGRLGSKPYTTSYFNAQLPARRDLFLFTTLPYSGRPWPIVMHGIQCNPSSRLISFMPRQYNSQLFRP